MGIPRRPPLRLTIYNAIPPADLQTGTPRRPPLANNRSSTQFLCLTVSVFLRMALFLFEVSVDLDETLNGRSPPKDNSDFDESWTELIVMI